MFNKCNDTIGCIIFFTIFEVTSCDWCRIKVKFVEIPTKMMLQLLQYIMWKSCQKKKIAFIVFFFWLMSNSKITNSLVEKVKTLKKTNIIVVLVC